MLTMPGDMHIIRDCLSSCYRITVEPPIMDTLKSGQPPYNGQIVCPLPIYCPYISTSKEGTTSEQWTKCSSPMCPLIGGSTVNHNIMEGGIGNCGCINLYYFYLLYYIPSMLWIQGCGRRERLIRSSDKCRSMSAFSAGYC